MFYHISLIKIRHFCLAVVLSLFASQALAQDSKTIDINQQKKAAQKEEVNKTLKIQSKKQEKLPGKVIFEQLVELFFKRLRHSPRLHYISSGGVCIVSPNENPFFAWWFFTGNPKVFLPFDDRLIIFTKKPLFIWDWWREFNRVIYRDGDVAFVEVKVYGTDEVIWKAKTLPGKNYLRYDGQELIDGKTYIVAFYSQKNFVIARSIFHTMKASMREKILNQLEFNRSTGEFSSDVLADADYFSKIGLWNDFFSVINEEKTYPIIAEKKLDEYSKKACSHDTKF